MNESNEKKLSNSTIRMSLLLLGVVSLLLLVNIQSVIGGKHKLLPEDQAISYKFKYLIGGNRLEEFKELAHLIKPKESILTVSNTKEKIPQGRFASKESDIIFLLGLPDLKISNTCYQYNLTENESKCNVIIEFNDIRQVVSCTVNDCE